MESPPRRRGKASRCPPLRPVVGITPAWAGKSPLHVFPDGLSGDHPRVGGEKLLTMHPIVPSIGSPPRGRGKAGGHRLPGNVDWITPAWAGKSRSAGRWSAQSGDHPRVGGEKKWFSRPSACDWGSPPRGRGKATQSGVGIITGGITPAWAGKRLLSMLDCAASGDHPRVGGEKLKSLLCSVRM